MSVEFFGRFYLDREKDIIVDLYREGETLSYVLRTPNHRSGNLISNLARLCELPLSYDEQGLKVIRGTVPCYVDGDNRRMYIFRMGNTKIANIFPDGGVEMKASIPSISKALMSQTKDYRLSVFKTIVKTYILDDCKFHTDLHTHMSANLAPDVLIALGIHHQIRYPLYYIKKLSLRLSGEQRRELEQERSTVAEKLRGLPLTGKYLERRIDDNTFMNFAALIMCDTENSEYNISRIRASLAVPKDGQAVFADLERVYLYRYVFTKGVESEQRIPELDPDLIPDRDIASCLRQMRADREKSEYKNNTLFQNKLLWIARGYRRSGIDYAEISDTSLVKKDLAPSVLSQIHAVMPAVTAETGVLLRFLAGIRRIPLTIVRDNVTPNDYLAENLQVLSAVAADPYIAGSDIVGEEINDITELRQVIAQLVRIAGETPGFVIRIHAGENDSLRDNVPNSIRCVRESLAPGQPMPRLRLGHGLYTPNLRSPGGQKLIRELIDNKVVLEFQITSNVRLNNLSDLAHHPLKEYLRAGIRCVQGTDGAALYGTSAIDEELSLEKLLELSHEELCQMRKTDAQLEEESRRVYVEKSRAFADIVGDEDVEAVLRRAIEQTAPVSSVLWQGDERLETALELSTQIAPLPERGTPIIIAGGSFNSARRSTRTRDDTLRLIDQLLEQAEGRELFFVIGHKLRGHERYLAEKARGRFPVYALVPSVLSRAELYRLRRSGVLIRPSIESNGNGLYKSFAYEIFKRRGSVLLAFDGNSPAANLVQEAKNGRYPCKIYVDGRCRALAAKARMLQGYVTDLRHLDAGSILAAIETSDNNAAALN